MGEIGCWRVVGRRVVSRRVEGVLEELGRGGEGPGREWEGVSLGVGGRRESVGDSGGGSTIAIKKEWARIAVTI